MLKFLERRQPLVAVGIVELVKKEVMSRIAKIEKIHIGRRSGIDRWVKQAQNLDPGDNCSCQHQKVNAELFQLTYVVDLQSHVRNVTAAGYVSCCGSSNMRVVWEVNRPIWFRTVS